MLNAIPILIAGLVAAAVAAVGHLVSWKSQQRSSRLAHSTSTMEARLTAALKLVEFRQRWIDRLRDQMSSYLALALQRAELTAAQSFELRKFGSSIRLHMNPEDAEYEMLKSYISNLDDGLIVNGADDFSKLFPEICQRILKREWDVLKKEIAEFKVIQSSSP